MCVCVCVCVCCYRGGRREGGFIQLSYNGTKHPVAIYIHFFFRNLHKCTKHFDWHIVLHCANDASVPSSPMAKSSKYLQHSLPPILHLMIKINNKKTSDNLCRRNSRCHFNGSFYTWEQKCTVTTLESMIKQQMLGFFFLLHCISKILWKVKKKKKKKHLRKKGNGIWGRTIYFLPQVQGTLPTCLNYVRLFLLKSMKLHITVFENDVLWCEREKKKRSTHKSRTNVSMWS